MIYMYLLLMLIVITVWIIICYKRSLFLIHMIQLEGYLNKNFIQWIQNNTTKVFDRKLKISSIVAIAISLLALAIYKVANEAFIWLMIVLWCLAILYGIKQKEGKEKIELVKTDRVRRLFKAHFLTNIILVLIISALSYLSIKDRIESLDKWLLVIIIETVFLTILLYLEPYLLLISNSIIKPIEEQINKGFFNSAKIKLKEMKNIEKIGITGSYGKTSTKFIVSTILGEKYKVMKTPESYNTPMGVSKVINNSLDENDGYDVFIAEMGARNIGDIHEMGDLVGHRIGIISSIGPAHLETFKNIENIKKTKYEIIEKLPTNGIGIFNYDNEYVRDLADETKNIKKVLYGIKNIEKLDIYAKDIEVTDKGSKFIIGTKDGKEISCETKLLGEHNIQNILAGVSAAIVLGLTLEEISKGISMIEPIPHRLQLINPGTGLLIIDDAFNSNPDGAQAALNVLSQFKDGRRIIVTPGMIELGDREYEENKIFGENISRVCDYAILVGKKRTEPIYAGLLANNFDEKKIFVVKNLEEATAILPRITRTKDVILFENDLPDNYNE